MHAKSRKMTNLPVACLIFLLVNFQVSSQNIIFAYPGDFGVFQNFQEKKSKKEEERKRREKGRKKETRAMVVHLICLRVGLPVLAMLLP